MRIIEAKFHFLFIFHKVSTRGPLIRVRDQKYIFNNDIITFPIFSCFQNLHTGLTDTSRMDEMYTLIRFTGPRFFSLMLPGYTAYVLDFLYAANTVISNSGI